MITFTKLRDGSWGVRGPLDEIAPGAQVTVTKRSGETQEATISEVVWENAEIAIARLAARQPQARQAAPAQAGPDVPAGRYAVQLGGRNAVEFFTVDRPTDGRWAGYTFVNQQASDDKWPVKGARKNEVLAAIAVDPQAALLLYGTELGRCGNCGRTLTDDISREMGIGPDCASQLGIARPARIAGNAPQRASAPQVASTQAPASVKVPVRHSGQLTELPGESWEDIFNANP